LIATLDNPDASHFCCQCGAELGRTLDETIRKRGFRDRQATEMEIADSVLSRLMKWAGWLGGIAALVLASFALALGLVYRDTRAALDAGKTQIESAVAEGKDKINTSVGDATKEIDVVKRDADDLGKQESQLRLDISSYKVVNGEMEKLQKQFHGQTDDLTKLDLRVHSLETVGSEGPSSLSFSILGCQPSALAKGAKVAYCSQGSPPSLYQRTASGDLRPVSSSSPAGFQDVSTSSKPACDTATRGTFYVEKGNGKETDKAFLCTRKSDNTFNWIQMSTVP